jgi:hypothetical protein
MFGFRRKTLYSEQHYVDFAKVMKEARDWMMESPESRSRHSLAVFFTVMADTFELDNSRFDRRKAAEACGFSWRN